MNYTEIINKQKDFFNSNQTKNIDFRIEQLKKLKAFIKLHESALYDAIYNDFKKSSFDTYATELSFVFHEIDDAIKNLPKWSRRKRATTNLINLPARSYIIPEPLGICLIIGAWNYPYMLTLVPLVDAIAAGNTIILKPSEIPPASSAVLARLINENFPSEYMVVVEGGIEETSSLLEQKFDKIFFTGSTAVGKIVYQAAAKHLTPVTLELGGKSPAFVTRSCNLKGAAKRIVWAKFLNAGQSCLCPDYVVVDEIVKEEFLLLLKDYILKFDYSFENKNYVQVINDRHFQRLTGLLKDHTIYFSGENDAGKRFIGPTILTDVTFDDKIMEDEIFGPILPVISYSDLNPVIKEVKSRPKPLSCYVFSNDDSIVNKILGELSFGGGAVNDTMMHISNHHLPFGGVGDSGMGNYHSEAGFAAFSHYKSILNKPFWFELNLKYSPYTGSKLTWLRRLMER